MEKEVSKKNLDLVTKIFEKNDIYYENIGNTQKDSLSLEKGFDIKVKDLIEINNSWFKSYFKEN